MTTVQKRKSEKKAKPVPSTADLVHSTKPVPNTADLVHSAKPVPSTADLVREVRSELGLTQADLGRMLGVHDQTIWRWEKGQFPPTPLQSSLLHVCQTVLAGAQAAVVRGQVAEALRGKEDALGPVRAMYAVLHAQFGAQ